MNNSEELFKRHPDMNLPYMECRVKWYPLVDSLLAELEDYYAENGADISRLHVFRIYEKDNRLKVEVGNYLDEKVLDIIEEYEKKVPSKSYIWIRLKPVKKIS